MTNNNDYIEITILKELQIISTSDNKQPLIEQFKQAHPQHVDWLKVFEDDNQQSTKNFNDSVKEIAGFDLIKLLGSGASGKVFLAQQHKPKRQVAIKVAMQYLSQDQIHRFLHESLILRGLSHPNIAQLFQSGIIADEKIPYIVMEYIDGINIHNYCIENKLSFKQILGLFDQVLDAVQYAHNKGIVHRDIKPENIMVNKDGEVKLLDFGIALVTQNSTQQLTQLTKTGEIVGTLAYMSPEQVSGQSSLDTRADVYSLGVVLYQLLANALPFKLDARHIFSAISQIIEDLPIKLTTHNQLIASDLAAIVHHAIEKKPDHRYQSPRDLKVDLKNWCEGGTISVKDNTFWRSIRHISKKHKALMTGSLLAVMGLITGIVFAVSFALKEQDARMTAEQNAKTSKKTVEFINELFSSADPEKIYGEKLTLLQVLDNADTALIGQLKNEYAVEANIRLTIAGVYISLGQHEMSQKQLNKIEQLFPLLKDNNELAELQFQHAMTQSGINLYTNKYAEDVMFVKTILTDDRFKNKNLLALTTQLAHGQLMLGQLDDAEKTIDNAIRNNAKLDESNHDLLFAQVIKAMILDKMGKFEESKYINEKVIEIRTAYFGKNHPRTLSALNNLSAVENNLGNFDKAKEIMIQVINGKTEVLGEKHLSTLISRTNFLSFLVKQQETDIADEYSKQLLIDMTEFIGPLDRYTLVVNNIRAYLLEDMGQLLEAEKMYTQTLGHYQNIGKNSGAELLVLQSNLAMLLMKQEKLDKSKQMFLELLNNVEKTMSKDHVYYAIFIGNYGELLLKIQDYSQARPFLQQSHDKLLLTFGENHQRTIKAKERLEQLNSAETK